jgi:hypothetical protein
MHSFRTSSPDQSMYVLGLFNQVQPQSTRIDYRKFRELIDPAQTSDKTTQSPRCRRRRVGHLDPSVDPSLDPTGNFGNCWRLAHVPRLQLGSYSMPTAIIHALGERERVRDLHPLGSERRIGSWQQQP